MNVEIIDRRIARFLGRVRLAFRGVINLVSAAGQVQFVQIDGVEGEQLQDVELFQHYGYTSHPPKGSMAIVLPIGGKTSHGVVIATEHGTYRLKGLESGEVALYSDEGDSVVLRRGRVVEVTTETFRINAATAIELNAPTITGNADTSIELNTPQVSASAQVSVAGLLAGNGGLAVQGGSGATFAGAVGQTGGGFTTTGDVVASGKSLASHTHGGVQPGSGSTGGPA